MDSRGTARRYAVVSGKGGVGKTMIAANVAAALAEAGERVLVIDADLGLANLDVILGLNPAHNLYDLLTGNRGIAEVLVSTPAGFDLIPAGSGGRESTRLTPDLAASLESLLEELDRRYDVILFDAGAGIGETVLAVAGLAHQVLLVATPEATSLMDAYATLKILATRHGRRQFSLVVNQADPSKAAQSGGAVAAHLQQVISRFLEADVGASVRLELLGAIPSDPAVARSINRRLLLADVAPDAQSTLSVSRIARQLQSPAVADRA